MAVSEQVIIEMQAQGGATAASQVDQVTEAVEGTGESAGATEGKFAKMAAGIAAGAAVAAAAVAAIGSALDVQDVSSKLQAQLGLDDSSADYGGKLAGKLYAQNFGESVEDTADSIRASVQNITGSLDDAGNESAAKALMGIKATFGAESDEVARTVGAMLKNGMATDADQAFDLITRGFQRGADKGGEFLDTLNEYSEPFKSLGFSARDMTNSLVQGSRNGVYSVDKIGDAVKEFSIRALDGSKGTAEGFKAAGLDADKMSARIAKGGPTAKKAFADTIAGLKSMRDPVKQEQAGVALFGSIWEDVGAKAILGLTPAQNALGKTKGATDAMNEALGKPLRARFEAIKRVSMAAFSAALIGSITAVANAVAWVVREFKKGNPIVIVTATVLGTITAIIVAQAVAMGVAAAATLAWTGITKAARAAQLLWNASLLANPLTWIAIAVVALGVAIWQLWKRNETFREGVKKAWAVIKSAVGSAVTWVKARFSDFKAAMRAVANWVNGAVAEIRKSWANFKSSAASAVSSVRAKFTSFVDFFKSIPSRIRGGLSTMWDGLKDGFKAAVNWIIGKWNGLELKIGGGSILGKEIPSVTLNTPDIPTLYTGGHIERGGMAMVGERGPELVKLPTGSTVYDNQQTQAATSSMGSGVMRLEVVGNDPQVVALVKLLLKKGTYVAAHT